MAKKIEFIKHQGNTQSHIPSKEEAGYENANLLDKIKSVEIGAYANWTQYSDHKPLMVIFEV